MTVSVSKQLEHTVASPPAADEAASKLVEHAVLLPPPGNAVDVAKYAEHAVLDSEQDAVNASKFVEHLVVLPIPGVIRVLLPPAELQFCDENGHPFAGGTLEMYVPGTTTPKDTWIDPGGTVLNPNPIVLDSAGRALIYGDGAYRTILRDAVGNLIWDQPSFTYVSSAMVPVVGAVDLATARQAMGVTDAINAEATLRANADAAETARAEAAEATLQHNIDTIALTPGPPGPSGTPGAPGTNIVQAGSAQTDASGAATITFATPFAACDGVVACAQSGRWWASVTSYNDASFTVVTTSPLVGGSWQGGPMGFNWVAHGH
jgi:hypothetical protein